MHNFQIGDMVFTIDPSLLRRETLPMGWIVGVRPGQDGLVPSASVGTAVKTYDQPIVKLCWLPVTS